MENRLKKIGIITLSASDNCGSLLQTYALQKTIMSRTDAEVEIINFESEQSKNVYELFPKGFYKHPKKTWFTIRHLKSIVKQKEGYSYFRKNYLNLTDISYETVDSLNVLNGRYDLLIAGSDQIWNIHMTDYSNAFFLPWDNQARKVAYAASLGSTQIIDGEKADEIKKYLDDFDFISLREETGRKTIRNLVDKKLYVTVDPTLLVSTDEWKQLAGQRMVNEPYIFFYSWSYPDESMNRLVEEFAKEKHLKVYVINSSKWYKFRPQRFGFELYEESGPIVFLNLMNYAEYVFVQSFHGFVFANLFRKRFFFLNEAGDGKIDFRAKNLMESLHEEKQVVHDMNDILRGMGTHLTYTSKEYEALINSSNKFIDEFLNYEERPYYGR